MSGTSGRLLQWIVCALTLLVAQGVLAADPSRSIGDYVVMGLHRARLGNEAFIHSGNVGVNDALGLVAQRELGVAKEGLVGGGHKPTCHLKDRVGGSGLDARGQFLSLRFLLG